MKFKTFIRRLDKRLSAGSTKAKIIRMLICVILSLGFTQTIFPFSGEYRFWFGLPLGIVFYSLFWWKSFEVVKEKER